jgi:hypothetical protein
MVLFGQIDPEGPESLEELKVVRAKQRVEIDLRGIGSPRKKQLDEIPATDLQRQVERGAMFEP